MDRYTFNYRVVRKVIKALVAPHEWFDIYRVYYKVGSTKASSWSTISSPAGETLKELKSDLRLMAQALKKPVLNHVTTGKGRKGLVPWKPK